jgi:hypothetical protein
MKNTIRFLALAGVALVLGGILSFVFRDWVRSEIAYPLAYLFWALRLIILSIPQEVFWWFLVILCLFVALYISWPSSLPSRSPISSHRSKPSSRYTTWLRYLHNLDTSRFASDNLARDLVRLTVQILADQQRLTPDEVYLQLDHNQIDLPPEFLAFLQRRSFKYKSKQESRLAELFHSLFPPRRQIRPPGVYSPAEEEASRIIAYVEDLFRQPDQTTEEINALLEENQ